MQKKTHVIAGLPKAGAYSHVVEAGELLFVSGLLPVDETKGLAIRDDIAQATTVILNNLAKALEACGSGLDQVVKVTVFLADMHFFEAMNSVYKTFFTADPPARSCVAVAGVPGGYPLEIEAVALKRTV